jgi:hypothetical protein
MSAREAARRDLAALLKLAYSAELAAYIAYHGHERSVRDPVEKTEIRRIGREELHHRHLVGKILAALGEKPSAWRELKMTWIGRAIWISCFLGGRFLAMYGAARLERANTGEYVTAARLAIAAGRPEFVADCIAMAEVEWDHERYFHAKARESRWMRFAPDWEDPPPRATIAAEFAAAPAETVSASASACRAS